jgi:MYXO-CTERM domain-containing protein
MMKRGSLACVGLALLAASLPASANGRYPSATQIVADRSNPARYAVRTTFGVLLSSDSGKSWSWVCESAMGIKAANADPTLGIPAAGALVSANWNDGLARSTDFGCGWVTSNVVERTKGEFFDDLVVRPDSPHTLLALNSGTVDRTTDRFTQLFQSTDDGVTWSAHGPAFDVHLLAETVEVAAADPRRIYVSAVRDDGGVRTAVLLVSPDDGATWEEHPIPFDPVLETGVFVSGVGSSNPDVVYVRTAFEGLVPKTPPVTNPARLLVTSDAGKTFREAYKGSGPLFGFALAKGKVYVGGPDDGLRVASEADLAFTKTSDAKIQGLMAEGQTLWAAANLLSGFILGTSTDDGAHWEPKLATLCDITGPLACAPGTQAAACPAEWPKLHDDLFLCDIFAPDGGAPSQADGGAAPAPAPAPHKGCGCKATPTAPDALAFLAVAFIVGRSRRRARAYQPKSKPPVVPMPCDTPSRKVKSYEGSTQPPTCCEGQSMKSSAS